MKRVITLKTNQAFVAVVCTLFTLSSVAKDGDTFRPYVSVSMSQDDNLLRYDSKLVLPDDVELSDTVLQTKVGIDVNWALSRQNFIVKAELNDSKYSNNSRLDNQGESIKAVWNWQVGSKLNGGIGYSLDQVLASFTDNQVVALSGAKRSTQNLFASGFWLLHPDWRAGVSLSSVLTDYDNSASAASNTDNSSTELSLFYLGFAGNSVGVKLRQNNTEFPDRVFNSLSRIDNQYQLSSVVMQLNWQFAGKSVFQGQLGVESLTNKHLAERDYSDITARITYQINPTGKFQFRASAWSEIASSWIFDAAFQRVQAIEFSPVWQMSSKNSLMLRYMLENVTYDGESGAADDRQSASIFWITKPVRNLSVTVGYSNNQRDSSRLFRDYESSMFTVQAKLIW